MDAFYLGIALVDNAPASIAEADVIESSVAPTAIVAIEPTTAPAAAAETEHQETQVTHVVNLSGYGQTATELFELKDGLAVFYMDHNGDGYFRVALLNKQGEQVEMPTIELGPANVSKATNIGPGVYLLDISADGGWSVRVE